LFTVGLALTPTLLLYKLTLPYRVLVMIFYSDYASDINDNTDLAVTINADIKYNTTTVNTDINFRFTNKF